MLVSTAAGAFTRRNRCTLSCLLVPVRLLRQLVSIGLMHAAVLVSVYFLLLVGDALFTSYAIVLRDAVFVSYVAQLGWLQRMASDVKSAIAFIVGLSALLQMLLLLWRSFLDRSLWTPG
jgi:hypothetical protein